MEIIDFSQKLPFEKSVGRRPLPSIRFAVVHHDAHFTGDIYDPLSRYEAQARYHIGKGWGHLSYSYRIARDGKVYQTLPENEIGYHAGNYKYNRDGLGICLDGDMSKQNPTKEQLVALDDFMRYLAYNRPDLPKLVRKSFFVHKEVRLWGLTFCPGPVVADKVINFRKSVLP